MIRHISSVALAAFVVVSVSACSKTFCRMRQDDARVDLNALHDAQSQYRETHGHFATSADLAFTPPDPFYYDVKIDSATVDTYHATAFGKRGLGGDVWTVNQLGHPVAQAANTCR